ncbi:MAG TPA: hypothetical protein VFR14_08320 [Candidatus Limnocylindrales bacterium]|nr:hypothetical protein [Candidatus Limnocylindrales bacterium]
MACLSLLRGLGVGLATAAAVALALAAGDVLTLVYSLPYAAVGGLLAVRRPWNAVGWLLIAIGWAGLFATLKVSGDPVALADGSAPLADRLLAWLAASGWPAAAVALLALVLDFPGGGRPRFVGGAPAALCALSTLLFGLVAFAPTIYPPHVTGLPGGMPNPVAIAPEAELPWSLVPYRTVLSGGQIVLWAAGFLTLVRRYRRSSGTERLQLRWILAALALLPIGVLTILVSFAVAGVAPGTDTRNVGPLLVAVAPAFVAWIALPTATGIAVLRYRLFEIDRIISRTLGWAIVTAILVATFAILVVSLQGLLAPWTSGNTLAVAGSTLAVAALFQPVRHRVQTAVDRRFHRARVDAQRTVDTFGLRLRGVLDTTSIAASLSDSVEGAVAPSRLTIWLRGTARNDSRTAGA